MAKDKYTAIWVSHTSISDFLECPRAYYLKNVYKDPKTNHKIKIMSPPLSLGQAVHEVLERLSKIPTQKRFETSLLEDYEKVWKKISGKIGGFVHIEQEGQYKARGAEMLRYVMEDPGPLKNLAVKIKMELPYFWLSESENIILCGKIDWLEYLPESDSVHIIDFKTSKSEENPDSLQLPIYHLLVKNCQNREATKASYWYLENKSGLSQRELPDLSQSYERVLKIARDIKTARKLERFKCPYSIGCRACKSYEAILSGDSEFVGVNEFNQDVYVQKASNVDAKDSELI